MANTYTQLYTHIVFAVKGRASIIHNDIKDKIYKYISGIISKQNQKLYIINGMPDHIHILVSMKPNLALSDLVKEIKEHSTKFINNEKLVKGKFYWQEGFGGVSVSHSQLDVVINYIKNQEEHHKRKTFKEEYMEMLKKYCIDYKDAYLFEWMEE
ncbi:MAG: IS200/IS605 family transposase [Bacteroidetes bacterium]|nr:MAG: IS200/IS605 family transposase [Bacteroidota bacterium]